MRKTLLSVLLSACAGCFTIHETEYPSVQMSASGDNEVGISLAGFEANVTTYIPVYGYETYHNYGYRRGRYLGPATVSTATYLPQTQPTSAFRDRATEILETNGFNLRTEKPKYRVEVHFSGPFNTDVDNAVSVAWTLLSVFSADYGVQSWTAKLKIYDATTGRLLMHHDYSERYQAVVWGPIPILSPACSEKTTGNAMQSWCLTALTDRSMADATAFIVSAVAQTNSGSK
jgi:hypothetical protein